MDVPQIQQEIYAKIVSLLVPATLPGEWHTHPAPADYFQTPPLTEELLGKLPEQFPIADLLAAGVVVNSSESGAPPQLHPQLRQPGSKWLALRETPASPPFDLVGDHGTLSGRLPVLAALKDHHIGTLLQKPVELLVAATVDDAAVLLAVGLPATVSAGLEILKKAKLREFCNAFALEMPGDPVARVPPAGLAAEGSPGATDSAPPNSDPPGLMLVGWSPGTLGREAPGQNVVRGFFVSLDSQLKMPSEFSWWQLSVENLKKFELTVKTFESAALREFLMESIAFCEALEPRKKPTPSPAATFAKPPSKKSSLNPFASERGAAEQRKVLEEQVFTPLLQSATSDDPLQKNLKFAVVQVSKVLHNHLARLNDAYNSKNKTWDEDDVMLRKFSQVESLLDMTLKVTRALQQSAASGH